MLETGILARTILGAGLNAETTAAARTQPAAGGFLDAVRQGMAAEEPQAAASTAAVTLEERLRARYPGLAYHVFDGSSRYWQTRQDFPFDKLYRQDCDGTEIENWKPDGPDPGMLSAGVQRSLGSIPPGSKAVIIHPAVQQKMEEDPAYADEIYARIEAWFTFDVARNEAILPGSTVGMSQCLAIGEDGQIANVQACGDGGLSKVNRQQEDEGESFWEARLRRHRRYMQQVMADQILQKMGIIVSPDPLQEAGLNGRSYAARAGATMIDRQLAAVQTAQTAMLDAMTMMESPQLRAALGETVAGVPLDRVFEATKNDITALYPGAASF